MKRSPLRQQSPKRRAEAAERRDVVEAARKAAGGRCSAAGRIGACGGGLTGHEVVKRSQLPGSHLDPRMVVCLCAWENTALEDLRLVDQEETGFTVPRWAWDRYGQAALDEAAAIRSGPRPRRPFWRDEEDEAVSESG